MEHPSHTHPLNDTEQCLAFSDLAQARRLLRTHLHGCGEAVHLILEKAQAAASGAKGSKNNAKKYFHPDGPTKARLVACGSALTPTALSDALHALLGKQALYAECAQTARRAMHNPKAAPQQGCAQSDAWFLERLKMMEKDYERKRGQLVANNLRLAAWTVDKLNTKAMPQEDLLQYGAIGLQKAVEAFDPSKGIKFSTFAFPVIKGEIIRACENFSHAVRLPSHVWVRMRRFQEVERELGFVLGKEPSPAEIALEMGVTPLEAAQLRQYQWAPVSLEAPLGAGEDGMSVGDTLVDQNASIPGSTSLLDWALIEPYADHLNFLERGVLKKYVERGGRQITPAQIALELGLSEDAVADALDSGIEKIAAHRSARKTAA